MVSFEKLGRRMDNLDGVSIIQYRRLKRQYLQLHIFYLLKKRSYTVLELHNVLNNELLSMGFRNDITLQELRTTLEDMIEKMILERQDDIITISE